MYLEFDVICKSADNEKLKLVTVGEAYMATTKDFASWHIHPMHDGKFVTISLAELCQYFRMPKGLSDKLPENIRDFLCDFCDDLTLPTDDAFRKRHIIADTTAWARGEYADTLSEEDISRIAADVAERWVESGDYDCNQSYWDNIRSLFMECNNMFTTISEDEVNSDGNE